LFAAVVNAEQFFRRGTRTLYRRCRERLFEEQAMRLTIMPVIAVLVALIAWPSVATAQRTTTTTRPAGTDFSVTTGIGSSASTTTHKVEPGPPREGSPIYGLYQSLPDEGEGGPDKSKIDQAKPAGQGAPPPMPTPEGPNAIARDRIESPQDK
jgi:hypothetical protein